ncbi:molybdate ABC transporter permease subunit [Pandoraea commovens]|uniref:ABC transporter permease subunit n=1 Tax=Pandoraea commovens TaxID=2508289 RepID=A0A5E4RUC7_9BURK|nr:ABC transporter permease subunit [Pandoraea commovens]UVA77288.1 ABC transporter permease subunit [Pandoraea commovens]VVD66064.1 sulfate ABC transporter permease [Pandoraea commovens]
MQKWRDDLPVDAEVGSRVGSGLGRLGEVVTWVLLAVPFVALAVETPWRHFRLAYGDWDAVAVSLGLSCLSMTIIVVLGTRVAHWLASTRSRLARLAQGLVLVALMTPPLAMGILLATAYGPVGTFGALLARGGILLGNNAPAFVLSQVYGGLPYFILAARAAFEAVPPVLPVAARSLGATPWQVFRRVTLPLARGGLAAGLVVAWVRVIGEFGIVMIFAYFPQGIPVKLYVNLQNDGLGAVYALLWLLLVVALPLPILVLMMTRRRHLADHTSDDPVF